MMVPKDSDFALFPFQRIMLRVMSRMNESYHVFSRGTSKSFLAFTERYIMRIWFRIIILVLLLALVNRLHPLPKKKLLVIYGRNFPY